MEDVYTLLCLLSAELSKAFCLRNLCYSKRSDCSDASTEYRVQNCLNLAKTRGRTKKYALRPNAVAVIPVNHYFSLFNVFIQSTFENMVISANYCYCSYTCK